MAGGAVRLVQRRSRARHTQGQPASCCAFLQSSDPSSGPGARDADGCRTANRRHGPLPGGLVLPSVCTPRGGLASKPPALRDVVRGMAAKNAARHPIGTWPVLGLLLLLLLLAGGLLYVGWDSPG